MPNHDGRAEPDETEAATDETEAGRARFTPLTGRELPPFAWPEIRDVPRLVADEAQRVRPEFEERQAAEQGKAS